MVWERVRPSLPGVLVIRADRKMRLHQDLPVEEHVVPVLLIRPLMRLPGVHALTENVRLARMQVVIEVLRDPVRRVVRVVSPMTPKVSVHVGVGRLLLLRGDIGHLEERPVTDPPWRSDSHVEQPCGLSRPPDELPEVGDHRELRPVDSHVDRKRVQLERVLQFATVASVLLLPASVRPCREHGDLRPQPRGHGLAENPHHVPRDPLVDRRKCPVLEREHLLVLVVHIGKRETLLHVPPRNDSRPPVRAGASFQGLTFLT